MLGAEQDRQDSSLSPADVPDFEQRPQLTIAIFADIGPHAGAKLLLPEGGYLQAVNVWRLPEAPPPDGSVVWPFLLMLVFSFCTPGTKHELSLTPRYPDGRRGSPAVSEFEAVAPQTWHAAVPLLEIAGEGLHVVEVRLDGHYYTAVPLVVEYGELPVPQALNTTGPIN